METKRHAVNTQIGIGRARQHAPNSTFKPIPCESRFIEDLSHAHKLSASQAAEIIESALITFGISRRELALMLKQPDDRINASRLAKIRHQFRQILRLHSGGGPIDGRASGRRNSRKGKTASKKRKWLKSVKKSWTGQTRKPGSHRSEKW